MMKISFRPLTLAVGLSLLCQWSWAQAAELSLAEAIRLAIRQNTGVIITQKGEAKAEANLRQAKGKDGLSVSLSDRLSASKEDDGSEGAGNTLSVSGSLTLYNGGKNAAAIESSKIGTQTAVLTTEREKENMKLSVSKAYYDVLQSRKTMNVRQEEVENYAAHYANVEQLYAAGSKAKIDALRSAVELSNAEQNLIKARTSYDNNLYALKNLINISPNEPLELTDDFVYEPFKEPLDECLVYAFAHRRDLAADENKLKQRELDVKIAKAGYLPSVDLNVGADNSSNFLPSSYSGRGINAGISANWNIFDSGVTKATVDAAKVDREVAALTLDKDRENIDLALRQAYNNMREAERRFKSTADAVGKAREDFFIAREKYRAGEGIMLDVIDAQVALSQAQLNYIGAQYDYARYKATVENAMGIPLTAVEKGEAEFTTAEAEAAREFAKSATGRKIVSDDLAKKSDGSEDDKITAEKPATVAGKAESDAVVQETAGLQ